MSNAILARREADLRNALLRSVRSLFSATLRGRSGQLYRFELFQRDSMNPLWDVGGVYAYSFHVPGSISPMVWDSTGTGLFLAYVGETNKIGRRNSEHRQDIPTIYDVVLVHRDDREWVRAEIERDLIEWYNPLLNDLLRSLKPAS